VTTTEGHGPITLSGLSVTEASGDSGDTINVTLSVGNGTLALGTAAGLTGTFSGSTLTFSGLASAVNTALGSVSYTPTSEFEGTDTVHFKASATEEVGGSTSALSTDHTATITVTGIADTPTTGTPAAVTTSEGQAVTLTGLSVTEASGGFRRHHQCDAERRQRHAVSGQPQRPDRDVQRVGADVLPGLRAR